MQSDTTKSARREEVRVGRIECKPHPLHGKRVRVLDRRHFGVERSDGSSMFAGYWYVLQHGSEALWLPCDHVNMETLPIPHAERLALSGAIKGR